jgi:hypothetical protein
MRLIVDAAKEDTVVRHKGEVNQQLKFPITSASIVKRLNFYLVLTPH